MRDSANTQTARNRAGFLLRGPTSALRITRHASRILLWLVPAFLVALLGLRFGMRLLGVRYDVPLPAAIYELTGPIVQPFYRWFPASERFDYYAVEWAALLAAGVVVAVALALYVVGLLAVMQFGRKRSATPNS